LHRGAQIADDARTRSQRASDAAQLNPIHEAIPMNTETRIPKSAMLSNEQLGNINAAGVATAHLSFISSVMGAVLALQKPRVNPVNPALHPDDPADGTAIQGMRNRGGGGSI